MTGDGKRFMTAFAVPRQRGVVVSASHCCRDARIWCPALAREVLLVPKDPVASEQVPGPGSIDGTTRLKHSDAVAQRTLQVADHACIDRAITVGGFATRPIHPDAEPRALARRGVVASARG